MPNEELKKYVGVLGIGCTLLSDLGFGIFMIHALREKYRFPENVDLIDGGLLGVGLTGIIAQMDHLIVIDVICNQGRSGDILRLEGPQILERLNAKNHIHQVEFLEALAHCQILASAPQTILLAIVPEDVETLACKLTPVLTDKIDTMAAYVLRELDRLGVSYEKKEFV